MLMMMEKVFNSQHQHEDSWYKRRGIRPVEMAICSKCGKPCLQEPIVLDGSLEVISYYKRRAKEMVVGKHTCVPGTAAVERIMKEVELYPRGNKERLLHWIFYLGMAPTEIAKDEQFYGVLHATFLCLQSAHSNSRSGPEGILIFNEGLSLIKKLFSDECPHKSISYKRSRLITSVCGDAFHNVLPCLQKNLALAYKNQYNLLISLIKDQLARLINRAARERDGELSPGADYPLPTLPPPLYARRAW